MRGHSLGTLIGNLEEMYREKPRYKMYARWRCVRMCVCAMYCAHLSAFQPHFFDSIHYISEYRSIGGESEFCRVPKPSFEKEGTGRAAAITRMSG